MAPSESGKEGCSRNYEIFTPVALNKPDSFSGLLFPHSHLNLIP